MDAIGKRSRVKWEEKEAAVRELEVRGKVDPMDLVNAAMNPKHPCHNDFTWDVEQAAKERWKDQAKSIIRRCKFEVITQDVTESVVRYVGSPTDGHTFQSLPQTRKVSDTSEIMVRELAMLHGNAARVYGIALAKQGMISPEVVSSLRSIRDQLESLKNSV